MGGWDPGGAWGNSLNFPYRTAHGRADRLMAEANAQYGDLSGGGGDEVEADARFVRGAGTGRQHDRLGLVLE